MDRLTVDGFMDIMRECAGEGEGMAAGTPVGDMQDTPFADLGYDSIALLEAVGRVERDYGVLLADEAVADAKTPRALVELVNSADG